VSDSGTVTVIIVTHNSLPEVENCLEHLKQLPVSSGPQVIIVDNCSTDATLSAGRNFFPGAIVITNKKNLGFGAACNQAAAVATSEYLLFLNPDALPDPESVTTLIAAERSTVKAGLVVGRLRFPDGRFQANCRNFPTINNLLFSRGSILGRLFVERFSAATSVYSLADYDTITVVPAVAATLMLVKRDLFTSLKGFDSRFFLYMEDTDLSFRISQAGYVNLFVPKAGAVHGFGKGAQVGRIYRSWHQHQSVWKYFLKHYPTGFSLILLPALLMANFLLAAIIPPRRG